MRLHYPGNTEKTLAQMQFKPWGSIVLEIPKRLWPKCNSNHEAPLSWKYWKDSDPNAIQTMRLQCPGNTEKTEAQMQFKPWGSIVLEILKRLWPKCNSNHEAPLSWKYRKDSGPNAIQTMRLHCPGNTEKTLTQMQSNPWGSTVLELLKRLKPNSYTHVYDHLECIHFKLFQNLTHRLRHPSKNRHINQPPSHRIP